MSRTIVLLVIILGLAACGAPRKSEPLAGPPPLYSAALEQGRVLYDRHCHRCHASGEGGLGPGVTNVPAPKALMRLQVRQGLGTMPGFSEREISDPELDQLLDYVLALRKLPAEGQASR